MSLFACIHAIMHRQLKKGTASQLLSSLKTNYPLDTQYSEVFIPINSVLLEQKTDTKNRKLSKDAALYITPNIKMEFKLFNLKNCK